MKRPVIGIIFVFLAELGFVVYTFLDRPLDASVAVNEVPGGTIAPPADVDVLGPAAEQYIVSRPVTPAGKRGSEAGLVSTVKAARRPSVRFVNRVPQYVALQKPRTTHPRQAYPPAMPLDGETRTYQLRANVVRSKNRSLLSRSVSVIKKPYDWLKAFGSRIK